jgi:hypothetical protein
MKVSEKGAVSVYGMGRFPVTLYKEQWLKLLNMSDEIRAFRRSPRTEADAARVAAKTEMLQLRLMERKHEPSCEKNGKGCRKCSRFWAG